jgi:poly(A) polymerase
VGNTPFGLVEQPRFRAGFDFMRLRADTGEIDEVLADWWEDFSLANDELRQDMLDQVREEQARQRAKTPRAPRAERGTTTAPARAEEGAAPVTEEGAAPKKRRRRRRSGARRSGDAAPDAQD